MCLKGLDPEYAAQHLRDLARLRRVKEEIHREYEQPLDVEAAAGETDRRRDDRPHALHATAGSQSGR